MAKPLKNSQSVKRPSLEFVLAVFSDVCKILGFDNEPMYELNDENIGLIKYYLDLPFNVVFGREKYKTLEEKAAAIFYFVTSNQSFPNGNKRTGIILTILLLIENGKYLKTSTDNMYKFSLYIANHHKKVSSDLKKVKAFIEENLDDIDNLKT